MSRLPFRPRVPFAHDSSPDHHFFTCANCGKVLYATGDTEEAGRIRYIDLPPCPTCDKETPMSKQRVHASLEAVELQTRAVEETATRLATKVYDLRSMVYTAREEVAGTLSPSTPVAWTQDMALAALESLGSFSVRRAAIEAMDGWSAERHAAARLSAAGALHMIAFPQQVDGIDPRD